MIPTVTAIDMPAMLNRFRQAHPEVRIALRSAGSDELETAIAGGALDIGLLGPPKGREPRGVTWRWLTTDRLVAVTSQEHRFANRAKVQLGDLAEEIFADFPAGTPERSQSDLAFAAAGLHANTSGEPPPERDPGQQTTDVGELDLAPRDLAGRLPRCVRAGLPNSSSTPTSTGYYFIDGMNYKLLSGPCWQTQT